MGKAVQIKDLLRKGKVVKNDGTLIFYCKLGE